MEMWRLILIYSSLTAIGFIGAVGRLVGLKLILCGPAASLSYMFSSIARLSDPEFAVSWRMADIYKTIALHGGIWLGGIGVIILFKAVGWKVWVAFVLAWVVAVPINLFYEMAQNV